MDSSTNQVSSNSNKYQNFNFDMIFAEYYDCIYKFINWQVQDKEYAKDLTQETFLRAFANIGTKSADLNVPAWLHTIAKNLCCDYWRKNKLSKYRDGFLDELVDCVPDSNLKPLDIIENQETAKQIYEVFNLMKTEQRTALILREIEDLPYEDAAKLMRISVSAYTSLLNRSRQKFIKLIMAPCTKLKKSIFTPKEYSVLYQWFGLDNWPQDPGKDLVLKAKSFFDKSAINFDSFRKDRYPSCLDQIILDRVLNSGAKVAGDFGSGTGQFTIKAASKYNEFYAFDISPNMLSISEQRFRNEGLRYIQCKPADINSIPLADDSLDIGYCVVVLHHLYNPITAIKEMVRTLKPGGQLLIADFGPHNYDIFARNNRDLWSGFSPVQMAQWFNEAGLENIKIEQQKECAFNHRSKHGEINSIPLLVCSGLKVI